MIRYPPFRLDGSSPSLNDQVLYSGTFLILAGWVGVAEGIGIPTVQTYVQLGTRFFNGCISHVSNGTVRNTTETQIRLEIFIFRELILSFGIETFAGMSNI